MRAIPLLCLLTLPSAFAAPVPKGPPSPVTSYTAEELAKLSFVNADKVPEKWAGRGDGPKPNLVALAVTLPKAVYEIGEPVELLFALKNRTDKPLGLGFRLDLFDDEPNCINSARIEIRDADTGKIVGPQISHSLGKWAGDGTRLLAKGYYAVSGNVGLGAGGKPLPTGKYELAWQYGWANSNTATFTVVDRHHRGAKTFRNLRLLRVTETDERNEVAKVREAVKVQNRTWEAAGVTVTNPSDAMMVLATGQLGRYYPSLRRIPESTKELRTSIRWAATDGVESFVVTMFAQHKTAKVSLPNSPFVYLLLECETEPVVEKLRERLLRDLEATLIPRIDVSHPFKLTVRLPKGWTDELGMSGPARVAVLLSTKELDDGGGLAREVKREDENEPHLLLRTPWRELSLPKTDRRK